MYLFRLLLAIWGFGVVGTIGELLLLEHFDGALQTIPLVLLGGAVVTSLWFVRRRTAASLRAFRATLALFGVSGAAGLLLHYRGNVEFEKERDASLHGLGLFWHAITGATPTLAPGTMVFLALIGLAVTIADPPPGGNPG